MQMPNIDDCELEILSAFEAGKLRSVATKGELAKFKAAARATAITDRLESMGSGLAMMQLLDCKT